MRPSRTIGPWASRRNPSRTCRRRGLAFAVQDIRAEMRRLREGGLKLVDAEPRPGARGRLVAFIHPRSAHGVLLELVQESAGSGSAPTQQD